MRWENILLDVCKYTYEVFKGGVHEFSYRKEYTTGNDVTDRWHKQMLQNTVNTRI